MEKITSVSPAGLEFIKKNEECLLYPTPDGNGRAKIGWGMDFYPNGVPVTLQDHPITQEQADEYFSELVVPYCQNVLSAVKVPLTQNQVDSLTDFTYNCGDGAFDSSSLCAAINNGLSVTEANFTEYDHVGQEVDPDLLARRIADYKLYITPTKIMDSNNQVSEAIVPGVTSTTSAPVIVPTVETSGNVQQPGNTEVQTSGTPVNPIETGMETVESLDGKTEMPMITPNFAVIPNSKYCMITGFEFAPTTDTTNISYTLFITDETSTIHMDDSAWMGAPGNLDLAAVIAYVRAHDFGGYQVQVDIQ